MRFLGDNSYIIAGSSIATKTIRDIDVYPFGDEAFIVPKKDIVFRTKNATTITVNNTLVQFCNYKKPTLLELLESFDFSHIQAGVVIEFGLVVQCKWTSEFLYSTAAGTSQFTGSEYPLSSLIRLLKYHKRQEISDRSSMIALFDIIKSTIERGFKGYDDFKDQLDAIDLGVVPEDIDHLSIDTLRGLFDLLDKGKG